MTCSVAEMVRVGGLLGARRETFYGLSGFGDLVATCHGAWSRNREFGHRIGAGSSIAGLLGGPLHRGGGLRDNPVVRGLCAEKGIDAPIPREMNEILFNGRRLGDALSALMMREPQARGGASPRRPPFDFRGCKSGAATG